MVQLFETTVLNLVNYASLASRHAIAIARSSAQVCTNAARYRIAAGADKELLEFGLRRAQGTLA